MNYEAKTVFEGIVIEKLEVIEKSLSHIHKDLYNPDGIEPRLREVETKSSTHAGDIKDLKKDRPKMFWLVGVASLIGGFLGKWIPWKG